MITPDPGGPLRPRSPARTWDHRPGIMSKTAHAARAAEFILDAARPSGTIPAVIGGILGPVVAFNSHPAVTFTLNQYMTTSWTPHRTLNA